MSLQVPSTIWVATAPINLRLSFDRLAGIVRAELGGDPKQPLLVMFHNRRRTHAKLLWQDGRGYCLFYKHLDRGRTFRIPLAIPPDAKSVVVDARELHLIFVLCRVIDNANGVPLELQKRIFELFFSTKPQTGTGLGLGMVQKLVTMHDGSIRLSTHPGQGSTFSFEMPLAFDRGSLAAPNPADGELGGTSVAR